MDKAKQLAEKFADKLKFLLLGGAAIALFTSFCRADYNFVIYLYMFYIWTFMSGGTNKESQDKEKITFFYILIYSFFVDIIWCIYWHSKWGLLKKDVESGTHGLAIFLSWIGILLKAVIAFVTGATEWNNIKTTLPKQLQQKLNSEYSPQLDDE